MAVSSKNIIIIGAGIAGLAANKYLLENGFDVTILEARDRAGGRIWTNYLSGIPIGAGAAWIHGIEDNPMSLLAEQFGASMKASDPEKFVIYDRDGKIIPQQTVKGFNSRFESLLKKAKEVAFNAKNDISLSDALSGFLQTEKFSSSEQDLLKTKKSFFEGYLGSNYEMLSARYWDQEKAWPGDNCLLTNTYQPILDGLLKNCQLHLNSVVKQINWHSSKIEIITEDKTFYCDAVLITVPLGVLKENTISFSPPLPDYKKSCINNLGMGLLNITAIKFSEVFWPKNNPAFLFTQFDSPSISIFLNFYYFIQQPVLVGYSGGETARQLEQRTDKQMIGKVIDNLKKVFGNKVTAPESYINTRWSMDIFCRGSYSYIPTGGSGEDYETLAKSISNRLFFAGEATHADYPATTHGAWLSGMREAEKIKKIFKENACTKFNTSI